MNYNTGPIKVLRDKILVTLILEPQTHFWKDSYTYFAVKFEIDDFPELNGTTFNNTFGQSSVSDTTDLLHNTGLSSSLRQSKLYDVYIESLTTFNCVYNDTKNTMAFKLYIKDSVNTTKSNLLSGQEVLIPNSSTPSTSPTTSIHRNKKSNYITTTILDKIVTIYGAITTLDNSTIFRNPTDTSNTDRLSIELILMPREN